MCAIIISPTDDMMEMIIMLEKIGSENIFSWTRTGTEEEEKIKQMKIVQLICNARKLRTFLRLSLCGFLRSIKGTKRAHQTKKNITIVHFDI